METIVWGRRTPRFHKISTVIRFFTSTTKDRTGMIAAPGNVCIAGCYICITNARRNPGDQRPRAKGAFSIIRRVYK